MQDIYKTLVGKKIIIINKSSKNNTNVSTFHTSHLRT